MSDLVFRKINGRIVPIRSRGTKPKDTTPATMSSPTKEVVRAGAGFSIAAGSGYLGGKLINQSWKAYGRSANMRGLSKLIRGRVPEAVANGIRSDAARFKVTGKALSRRGFGILGLGLSIGAGMVVSSIKNMIDRKKVTDPELKATAITAGGAAVTALGLTVFGRKAGISHIKSALKATGGMNVKNAYSAFTKFGQSKTRNIVRQYAAMAKKGSPTFTVRKVERILKRSATKKSVNKYNIPGQGSFDL